MSLLQTHDLVCLSHLRWDFVTQRPQHLLTRAAREGRRVFFVEEPFFDVEDDGAAWLEVSPRAANLLVAQPHLPAGLTEEAVEATQEVLLDRLLAEHAVRDGTFIAWYYTPMALGFSRHLRPLVTVYDCMDELSAFLGAPLAIRAREADLFARADLVFTGGPSLYESKRHQHSNVHLFPSSVDLAHFARARGRTGVAAPPEPADQAAIPRPRLGFFGVLDERLDVDLLAQVARLRPDWQLVLLGPVAKIAPTRLPRASNLHYLGSKRYEALPDYVAGWDAALLPFARNESTRFISPTKTPEYLAAGLPVVSTPIRDVVRPYGDLGLVHVAETPEAFVAAVEVALAEDADERIRRADLLLAQTSWDGTWSRMSELIDGAAAARVRAGTLAERAQAPTRRPVSVSTAA